MEISIFFNFFYGPKCLDLYLHCVYTRNMINTVITKWGNSHALRLPLQIVKAAGIACNDKVYLETHEDKIIISKIPMPKQGTLEYLFKDYTGESFETVLVNPAEPVGNEQW